MLRIIKRVTISAIMILTSIAVSAVDAMRPEATVEGTVTMVSSLPLPRQTDYDDCLYTLRLRLESIRKGIGIEPEIQLVVMGFQQKKLIMENQFKVGDKIRAEIISFEKVPEKISQRQQVDDIQAFELSQYYLIRSTRIETFSPDRPIPFGTRAKPEERDGTGLAREYNTTHDQAARRIRAEQMAHDLAEAKHMLESQGGVKAWRAKLQPQYQTLFEAMQSNTPGRWIENSFFSAEKISTGMPKMRNALSVLDEFNRYLKKRNIDLILLRVPTPAELSADLFAGAFPYGYPEPFFVDLRRIFLEQGIELLDPLPAMLQRRHEWPYMYWYMNPQESHPAEGAVWCLSEVLAKRIARYEFKPNISGLSIKPSREPSYRAYRNADGNPRYRATDYVTYSTICDGDGKYLKVREGEESPILIMGDSFTSYPRLDCGASISHYFAQLTGIVPDLLLRDGSGRGIIGFLMRKNEKFLRNKKVVIFVMPNNNFLQDLIPMPYTRTLEQSKFIPVREFNSSNWNGLGDQPELRPYSKEITVTDGDLVIERLVPKTPVVIKLPVDLSAVPNDATCLQVELIVQCQKYHYFNYGITHGTKTETTIVGPQDSMQPIRMLFPFDRSAPVTLQLILNLNKTIVKKITISAQ